VSTGKRGTQQFPVQRVESYTTSQALDNDADSFSIDIGDSANKLALCLDRDNEVRLQLYLDDPRSRLVPIFNGITDGATRAEDFLLSLQGRDTPSSLAVDSDAIPYSWNWVNPEAWLKDRAAKLGIHNTHIHKMSTIKSLKTDGSEKEWALWYRVARMKNCYMWSNATGGLIVDRLGYSLTPTYHFGSPPAHGSSAAWQKAEAVNIASSKQGRVFKVLMYGEDAKKGKAMIAQSIDHRIAAWKKQRTTVLSVSTAKTQKELQRLANEETFEGTVGAQELQLTIHDTGVLIQQNKMALVNLPDYDIHMEMWFVVGVERRGGEEGMTQIVRLREKGFAITHRVPTSPVLNTGKDKSTNKPITSIGAALTNSGIRWGDSFVRATNEFGKPAGWDFGLFLGVLLAICQQESSFHNCREGDSHTEWQPYDKWLNSGERLTSNKTSSELEVEYARAFANDASNSLNPYHNRGNAGVGPMQLTSQGYKDWADQYGWNGVPNTQELSGGRWNPDSNIRASARALLEKLRVSPPADPNNGDTIWVGVERYNGSAAYRDSVYKLWKNQYAKQINDIIASIKSTPPGAASFDLNIPGHDVVHLPDVTPKVARKALNWALSMLGDPYKWGGYGPHYDCSSFVTRALAMGGTITRGLFTPPNVDTKTHGDDTYKLFTEGDKVLRDNLLPADLVFFRGNPPEHVGIYIFDGLFFHDPKPGDVVKVSSINDDYYREQWTGARRFIGWPSGNPD
jgi:prophage tail gpP-like protein